MPYKCFLIEQDGEWREGELCNCGCGTSLDYSGSWWVRKDTGERHKHIRDFAVGAMWFADWLKQGKGGYGWDWDNQDTPPLVVKTPGGDWVIDSRASNCTMKDDKLHRCWVRHGEPPIITVDKSGNTCAAGAGSIMCGSYHGFLRDGHLTDGNG